MDVNNINPTPGASVRAEVRRMIKIFLLDTHRNVFQEEGTIKGRAPTSRRPLLEHKILDIQWCK